MKEQLISFKTAKLAKEKGFKSKSRYYDGSEELVEVPVVEGNDYRHTNNMMQRFRYEAPTQSLLQKWLRETHHIDTGCVPEYGGYTYWLNTYHNISWTRYNTYELALEDALFKSLKLIK